MSDLRREANVRSWRYRDLDDEVRTPSFAPPLGRLKDGPGGPPLARPRLSAVLDPAAGRSLWLPMDLRQGVRGTHVA